MFNRIISLPIIPIRTNATFIVTMLALGTISDIFIGCRGSRLWGLAELWFDVYITACILTLFPTKIRRFATRSIYVITYSLAIIDGYLYYATGQAITPHLITLIALTNAREAGEAIQVYISLKPFLTPWILIWGLILVHKFILNKKDLNNVVNNIFNHINNHQLTIISSLIVASNIGIGSCIWQDKVYKHLRLTLGMTELETQKTIDLSPFIYYKQPLYRLINSLQEYLTHRNAIQQLTQNINTGTVTSCSFVSPNIIFIIGESLNKHHTQLYGYNLPTTPNQTHHLKKGNLITFTDAIASWNTTCESLQNIFSLAYYGGKEAWYESPFFTTLFRKAGYDVNFLSNQYTLDITQSMSNYIEDIFINIPYISDLQFTHRNPQRYTYDDELLNDLNEIPASPKSPTLTILHFSGSHFEFSERYPATQRYFTARKYHRPDLTQEQLEVLAHYDNSIRFNDSIIGKIIQRYEEKSAIIVHLADHGERVFDLGDGFGRSLGNTYAEIKSQFEIPMWIWCSDLYKQQHPDIWAAIQRNHTQPYMTDAIAHTLLFLAGINSPEYQPTLNILSEQYDAQRKRIIRSSANYDDIVKSQKGD